MLLENIIVYGLVALISAAVFFSYYLIHKRKTKGTIVKIQKARELGFHEPVSLHPVVNKEICIGSGACVSACPEKDIIGMVNGQAAIVNASRCVGHGACFHACPVNAITLCIGTEKRGVELPHVSERFETNIPGIYIAGELGGMGLIKNAVEQGRQAVENIARSIKCNTGAGYDIIIVGAGPAGISATLTAAKMGLRYLTLEQDTLGGTVYNFPRAKLVMTSPVDLPLYGRLKLNQTSKSELLGIWQEALSKNGVKINEQEKVLDIKPSGEFFTLTSSRNSYTSSAVLLAIGRRGSPRKLGVKGEEKEKVAYRLLEPELIENKKILVIGGGDSAVESALLLNEQNEVTLSYRGASFSRLKPQNLENIAAAEKQGSIRVLLNTNIKEIRDDDVILISGENDEMLIENDLVYIFAGGELPTAFLQKTGINITTKFGEAVLKHSK